MRREGTGVRWCAAIARGLVGSRWCVVPASAERRRCRSPSARAPWAWRWPSGPSWAHPGRWQKPPRPAACSRAGSLQEGRERNAKRSKGRGEGLRRQRWQRLERRQRLQPASCAPQAPKPAGAPWPQALTQCASSITTRASWPWLCSALHAAAGGVRAKWGVRSPAGDRRACCPLAGQVGTLLSSTQPHRQPPQSTRPAPCPPQAAHPRASLRRCPLTSCSGVTYSSLAVGRGLRSSRNTAWGEGGGKK